MRRRDRHPGRHGDPVRRHPARRGHHLDDDQRAGRRSSSRCTSRWPRSRASTSATSSAARCRTTSSRSTSPRRSASTRRGRRMRLITDMIAFCSRARAALEHDLDLRLPHPRGRLDGASRSWPSRCADGIDYVELGIDAGLDVDALRPAAVLLLQRPQRLLRGDRQVPRRPPDLGHGDARPLRRARTRARWMLRFHTQTAGCSLTAPAALQQRRPHHRSRRWPAVLGGTQSLHTNSLDETLALPTEEAVTHRAAHPADHRPRVRAWPTPSIRSAAPASSRR